MFFIGKREKWNNFSELSLPADIDKAFTLLLDSLSFSSEKLNLEKCGKEDKTRFGLCKFM